MSRPRVATLGGILVAFVVAFAALWAIPNVAGSAFVDVRAIASSSGSGGPVVLIGSSSPVAASAVEVGAEVANRYPLPVVIGSPRPAFQAVVYRRASGGRLVRVWAASAEDPAAEEASDSPAGGGSPNVAAVLAPGSVRHSIAGGATSFPLVDPSGVAIPAGVYYLRVWAYGIGSPIVPISVAGATDPLGVPNEPADPAD